MPAPAPATSATPGHAPARDAPRTPLPARGRPAFAPRPAIPPRAAAPAPLPPLRHGRYARAELARDPQSAATARRLARTTLTAWGITAPALADDAEQVMSEIAANAVRFSLPPVRDRPAVYAALHHDPERGELTLYVWDNGPAYPEPAPPAADPAASENGRGLLITDALSREWGYWATPASGGKVTYAVLGIPAPGAPPQPG